MTPDLFQISLDFQGNLIEWEEGTLEHNLLERVDHQSVVVFAQHRGVDEIKVFIDQDLPENFVVLKREVLDQLETKLTIAAINSWNLIYAHPNGTLTEKELRDIVKEEFAVVKPDEKGWNIFNGGGYLVTHFAHKWEGEFFLALIIQIGVYDFSNHRFLIDFESYLGLKAHIDSYILKLFRKLPLKHRYPVHLLLAS